MVQYLAAIRLSPARQRIGIGTTGSTLRFLARLGGGGPSEKRLVNDDLIPAADHKHDEHREADELERLDKRSARSRARTLAKLTRRAMLTSGTIIMMTDDGDERDKVSDHHRPDAGHDWDHQRNEPVPAGRAAMQRRMLTLPLADDRRNGNTDKRTLGSSAKPPPEAPGRRSGLIDRGDPMLQSRWPRIQPRRASRDIPVGPDCESSGLGRELQALQDR